MRRKFLCRSSGSCSCAAFSSARLARPPRGSRSALPAAREADIEERLGGASTRRSRSRTWTGGAVRARRALRRAAARPRRPRLLPLPDALRPRAARPGRGHGEARLPARRAVPRPHGELRSADTPASAARQTRRRPVGAGLGGRAEARGLALPHRRRRPRSARSPAISASGSRTTRGPSSTRTPPRSSCSRRTAASPAISTAPSSPPSTSGSRSSRQPRADRHHRRSRPHRPVIATTRRAAATALHRRASCGSARLAILRGRDAGRLLRVAGRGSAAQRAAPGGARDERVPAPAALPARAALVARARHRRAPLLRHPRHDGRRRARSR